MTPEEHRRLRFQVRARTSQLLIETSALGEAAIDTAAMGVVEGLTDFLRAYLGDRGAYDLLQAAADGVMPRSATETQG